VPDRTTQVLAQRYKITEPVAKGGMATVWRGIDQRLGREVAVKILHNRHRDDPSVRERFRREAVAAASFNHSNIATIYDSGEDDDAHFIVMELIKGPSLSRLLGPNGRLHPPETVHLLRSVLSALSYAHTRGVIHRDIKPANILLWDHVGAATVKVVDFGIARAISGGDLTQTGSIIGTASYLAPEQVEGAPCDHRVDLYALGCVGYRCLSGRVPWSAETDIGTAIARTREDADPLHPQCPKAPKKLVQVIEKAMARAPSQRFSSAGEMLLALSNLKAEKIQISMARVDTPAPQQNKPSRSRSVRQDPSPQPVPEQPVPEQPAFSSSPTPAPTEPPSPPSAFSSTTPARRTQRHNRKPTPNRHTRLFSENSDEYEETSPKTLDRFPFSFSSQRQARWSSHKKTPAHSTLSAQRTEQTSYSAGNIAKRRARQRLTTAPRNRQTRIPRSTSPSSKGGILLGATAAIFVFALLFLIFSNKSSVEDKKTSDFFGIRVIETIDFDPEGDDRQENPKMVSQATDGDHTTAWKTESYRNYPDFGRLKDGVGLFLRTEKTTKPGKVWIYADPGTTIELRTADKLLELHEKSDFFPDNASLSDIAQHTSLADVTQHTSLAAQAATIGAEGRIKLDLGESSARNWLLWITHLPATNNNAFRTRIFEVQFGENTSSEQVAFFLPTTTLPPELTTKPPAQ